MPKSQPKKTAAKPKPAPAKSAKGTPSAKGAASAKGTAGAKGVANAKSGSKAAKPRLDVKANSAKPAPKGAGKGGAAAKVKTPDKVKAPEKAKVPAAPAAKAPEKAPVAAKPVEKPRKGKVGDYNESVFTTSDGKSAAADAKLTPFLRKQKERLVQLRDNMLDSMSGVAKDTLRSRAEGSEASAFGMHQADAGSDAYDRDFALSLLSQEQDALYEIEQALKRIDMGTYGMCEMSNKPIAHARLEAIPFTRYTVECQAQLEKQNKVSRSRVPVTSLFGLTEGEDTTEGDEEETPTDTKD